MGWSPDDKHRRYVQRCAGCGALIHEEEIYCAIYPHCEPGIQPDPAAAKLVSDVALLLERYGDHFFDG